MNLDAIVGNPVLKKMLMGQLKKTIAENGVQLVTIAPDSSGELVFEVYTEPMTVTTAREFDNLVKSALE